MTPPRRPRRQRPHDDDSIEKKNEEELSKEEENVARGTGAPSTAFDTVWTKNLDTVWNKAMEKHVNDNSTTTAASELAADDVDHATKSSSSPHQTQESSSTPSSQSNQNSTKASPPHRQNSNDNFSSLREKLEMKATAYRDEVKLPAVPAIKRITPTSTAKSSFTTSHLQRLEDDLSPQQDDKVQSATAGSNLTRPTVPARTSVAISQLQRVEGLERQGEQAQSAAVSERTKPTSPAKSPAQSQLQYVEDPFSQDEQVQSDPGSEQITRTLPAKPPITTSQLQRVEDPSPAGNNQTGTTFTAKTPVTQSHVHRVEDEQIQSAPGSKQIPHIVATKPPVAMSQAHDKGNPLGAKIQSAPTLPTKTQAGDKGHSKTSLFLRLREKLERNASVPIFPEAAQSAAMNKRTTSTSPPEYPVTTSHLQHKEDLQRKGPLHAKEESVAPSIRFAKLRNSLEAHSAPIFPHNEAKVAKESSHRHSTPSSVPEAHAGEKWSPEAELRNVHNVAKYKTNLECNKLTESSTLEKDRLPNSKTSTGHRSSGRKTRKDNKLTPEENMVSVVTEG